MKAGVLEQNDAPRLSVVKELQSIENHKTYSITVPYHTEIEMYMLYTICAKMYFTNTYLGVPQFVLVMVYIQGAQKLL